MRLHRSIFTREVTPIYFFTREVVSDVGAVDDLLPVARLLEQAENLDVVGHRAAQPDGRDGDRHIHPGVVVLA